MDLDELQSVRDRERQTDKLQQLRTSFYADAGEFIQSLREQRERAAERADNPFDAPEVNRLSDEIDTAEQTVEAIYEKRVGKIVKAASFAAADLPAEVEGMTAEEEELFDSLVADIEENRQHVLDVLAGDADEESPNQSSDGGPADSPVDADQETPIPPEPGEESSPDPREGNSTPVPDDAPPAASEVSAADLMGEGTDETERRTPSDGGEDPSSDATSATDDEPDDASDDGRPVRNDGGTAGVERATVRITDDVGAIFGVDKREYDLSEDDVVTLPTENVEPLLQRDAATRLD